jgi:tRNA-Thr(GGU) m(6)t(6)A37 methyltransferase TsaA
MKETDYQLLPIGFVRSPLTSLQGCPKQGSEGAPEAWIEIDPAFSDALDDLAPGQEIIVLTWLHKANRYLLKVHTRGNPEAPLNGVFSTRSPDRPNPIGLHRVAILEIQRPGRIRVRPLEALDGTPVIDIKPVLMSER